MNVLSYFLLQGDKETKQRKTKTKWLCGIIRINKHKLWEKIPSQDLQSHCVMLHYATLNVYYTQCNFEHLYSGDINDAVCVHTYAQGYVGKWRIQGLPYFD